MATYGMGEDISHHTFNTGFVCELNKELMQLNNKTLNKKVVRISEYTSKECIQVIDRNIIKCIASLTN